MRHQYTIDANVMRTGTCQLGFFFKILKMSKTKMNQKKISVLLCHVKKLGQP